MTYMRLWASRAPLDKHLSERQLFEQKLYIKMKHILCEMYIFRKSYALRNEQTNGIFTMWCQLKTLEPLNSFQWNFIVQGFACPPRFLPYVLTQHEKLALLYWYLSFPVILALLQTF